MPRNLEVLTDKELFLKTKRIAEFVRNAKIDLWYGSSENWCRYLGISRDKKLFHVCIAEPIVKHIQKYTNIYKHIQTLYKHIQKHTTIYTTNIYIYIYI